MGNFDNIDDEILQIAKLVQEDQNGTYIRNKEKSELVEITAQILKRIIDCDRIFCKIDTPFMGSTDICIVGEEINIKNPKLFVDLVRHATNSEVYAKTDGTVQMNMTYYRTSIKLK